MSHSEAPHSELLTPLTLEPILVERVWGTYDLGKWHTPSTVSTPIGELWLTAEECRIEPPGGSLKDRVKAQPRAFGDSDGGGFPLLIKLLFPREKLSVQVHPNDAEAQAAGQLRGKTECWYVLSAERGAKVAVGFERPLSAAQIRGAIAAGALESELRMLPVQAGDMVFVEAGTVHAIGPGMVVLETQQYCDVTYRLWDYGRPRELHLDAGLAVTRAETPSGLVAAVPMEGFDRLVTSPYFAVDRFRLTPGAPVPLGDSPSLQILIATTHAARLRGPSGIVDLPLGHAVVLPARAKSWSLYADGAADAAEIIRVLQPPAVER